MTPDEFRSVLHRAPFEAFTIHLADGQSIQVPHPDFVALTGDGLSAVITSARSGGFSVIDLMLVTRLEVPSAQQQAR